MGQRAVLGIVGWSGSGKTSLVARLVRDLVGRGYRISTIKHAHSEFDIDTPGKDSYAHRKAGAHEVLVSSASRFALMHENRGAPEPTIDGLLAKLEPADLVLIEGFKSEPHDKLEVHRPSLGKPVLQPRDPDVVAVATDAPLPEVGVPVLDLNDEVAVADFVIAHCGLGRTAREAG